MIVVIIKPVNFFFLLRCNWIIEADKRIHSSAAWSARLGVWLEASYFFLDWLLLRNILEQVNCFTCYSTDRFLLILDSVYCKI